MTFGNRTIKLHLLKGFLGMTALAVSLDTINAKLWPSVVLLPLSLYLLRGCPVCWTLGLIETIVMKFHAKIAESSAHEG